MFLFLKRVNYDTSSSIKITLFLQCLTAYLSLGCWKDQCIPSNQNCSRRVLESLEKKATYAGPGSSIFYNGTHGTHYKRRSDAVKKCMVAALEFGYDIFAVQDGGQCFSGANAGTAYKTEKSSDCDGLTGGPMANDVFIISKFLSLAY